MNVIINPLNKQKYLLQSKEGKNLLKEYIKIINGGSGICAFFRSLCKGRKCRDLPKECKEPIIIKKSLIIENNPKPLIIYDNLKLKGTKKIGLRIYSEHLINKFRLQRQTVEGRTYNLGNLFITIQNIELQITNKGLNINGVVIKVDNKQLEDDFLYTEYNLHNYLYNNIESVYNVKNELIELFRNYLLGTNINPTIYDRQPSNLYLEDSDIFSKESSKYYKIHFSINLEFWKETFDFLIDYYRKNGKLISRLKFVFPKLSHYRDINDDILNDLTYNFDFGAGIANFVIYPNSNNRESIFYLIDNLVKQWMLTGLDKKAGRKNNNLFFNERLTKTIYIGYGSDTDSKATSYINNRKNNNKIILDSNGNYRINSRLTRFKNTPELQEEIINRCNRRLSTSKKNSIDRCLKNKYNLRPIDLCSTKDLRSNDFRDIELKRNYKVDDNRTERNVNLSDNWVYNDNSTVSYNNIINKKYGKRCYN